jgi:Co/Zn/Cd efflux system component
MSQAFQEEGYASHETPVAGAGYDIGDYQSQTEDETSALLKKKQSFSSNKTTKPLPKSNKNNNIFVLWVTIICVFFVTSGLAVAAVLSRSLALTADVVQNAVDLSTYSVNLYAEYQKGGASKRLELAAATFSVVGLIAVGAWVFWAALDRFHTNSLPGHFQPASARIDAHLLLAFTVVGFLADMFVATIFCKYVSTDHGSSTDDPLLNLEDTSTSNGHTQKVEKNVNMISAGAHVMTDAIRSIAIVSGAFLIFLQHHKVIKLPMQEEVMDGVLSCFVVGCMAIAVLFVSKEIYYLVQDQVAQEGGISKFICESQYPNNKKIDQQRQQNQQEEESVVGNTATDL